MSLVVLLNLKTLKAFITVWNPSSILEHLSFNGKADIYDGNNHKLLLDGQLPSNVRLK